MCGVKSGDNIFIIMSLDVLTSIFGMKLKDLKVYDVKFKRLSLTNGEGCNGCGVCVGVCPCGAIDVVRIVQYSGRYRGHLKIDFSKCIGCGNCVEVCPERVLSMEGKWFTVSRVDECVIEGYGLVKREL